VVAGGGAVPAHRALAVVGEVLAGRDAEEPQEGQLHHAERPALRVRVGELREQEASQRGADGRRCAGLEGGSATPGGGSWGRGGGPRADRFKGRWRTFLLRNGGREGSSRPRGSSEASGWGRTEGVTGEGNSGASRGAGGGRAGAPRGSQRPQTASFVGPAHRRQRTRPRVSPARAAAGSAHPASVLTLLPSRNWLNHRRGTSFSHADIFTWKRSGSREPTPTAPRPARRAARRFAHLLHVLAGEDAGLPARGEVAVDLERVSGAALVGVNPVLACAGRRAVSTRDAAAAPAAAAGAPHRRAGPGG